MPFPVYKYPRIKPFVEFCWRKGIVSFFKIPGLSIDLDDEKKFIYNVCSIMDGSISLQDLKERMSSIYPYESQFLDDLLSALDNEYLIEDVFYNIPNATIEAQERWSKNVEFLGSYCRAKENKHQKQQSLSEIKVVILGLGGVGSNVLLNLAALGVLNFRIVDYDKVSLSNLNRQILYSNTDIGHYKSDMAKQRILQFLPNANIECCNKKLESTDDVLEMVRGYDFVIAAADMPREKILDWVNNACLEFKIPYICGGLDSLWATYFSIIPGITGCMACWKQSASKDRALYQDIVQAEYFSSAPSPNVAIMPMISMVSGLISSEFLKIVTKISEPNALGKLCIFNFKSSEMAVQETWEKLDNCPICSKEQFN
ncbi:ThiF family adenylyltransferase [Legionella lytica]|uniref:ThiF family adenylyltransferase n=1 Tax=Legionella lytica TaxID=96232 RepID=A0ABW8D7H2_9GAMM